MCPNDVWVDIDLQPRFSLSFRHVLRKAPVAAPVMPPATAGAGSVAGATCGWSSLGFQCGK